MKPDLYHRDREVVFAAGLLALGTVLAFAPDAFLPMLARAFLVQWSLVFAAFAAWAFLKRRTWPAWASALSTCMVLLQVDAPVAGPVPDLRSADLRIAQVNLLQPNTRHAEVIRLLRASDADVISVQEVSPLWAAVLVGSLRDAYPHFKVVPDVNCYGIALFSRRPVERMVEHALCGSPAIEAVLKGPEGPVHVFTVHATSPGDPADHRLRNTQLGRLARLVRSRGQRTIVVGDLNTVSWDRAMWTLCRAAGLRIGTSPLSPTFPAVLGFALIPIDHVLTSSGATVVRSSTFSIPGSDHRGLLADIAT
ncbi:MAG: endonuclease/exonuclease/phosphatase family protein [Flavobacteriales bacterium]|nr:endonuclease/exonuclease/phosphatase family protein [Flavobacteriales bacterium]